MMPVLPFQRDCHLLVLPSMLPGMPLTPIEAMFCGRPVLCWDVSVASGLTSELGERVSGGFSLCGAVGLGPQKVWPR